MIIIDIDMPTGCSSCPIYDGEYGECQLRTCFHSRFADVHALFDDRPNNCPLKDRPHGTWVDVPKYKGFYVCSKCLERLNGDFERFEQWEMTKDNFCRVCGSDNRKRG